MIPILIRHYVFGGNFQPKTNSQWIANMLTILFY